MKNEITQIDEKNTRTVKTETQSRPVNVHRRKFASSGVAVSGVLLTLASRPVLGQIVCKSPSGFLSGNASTHGEQPICMGRTPDYWKNNPSSWPISTDTLFRNVFTCSPTSLIYPESMMTLLTLQPYDQNGLAMHLVAAYLNAVSGFTPFLPVETIKAMFSEWQSQGVFSPAAQVSWTSDQIVAYLQKTQS